MNKFYRISFATKVLLLLHYLTASINCYKILGVFPCPSRSHYAVGHALMKGLADDGHEVTMVSPFSQNQPIKNYTEVLLEHSWAGYKRGIHSFVRSVEVNSSIH